MNSSLKIVLTGGPYSGKSSLIAALSKRGYDTVPEQAIIVIEQLIQTWDKNTFTKWKTLNMPAFQQLIFNAQRKIENQNAPKKCCFFDRGILDPVAYLIHNGLPTPDTMLHVSKQASYDMVIVCDTLDSFDQRKHTGRTESRTESIKIGNLISQTYLRAGFPVIRLSEASIEARTKIVLALMEQLPSNTLTLDKMQLSSTVIK